MEWLAVIGKWFSSTKLGQATSLAIAVSAAVFATWSYVDGKAYERGYQAMKLECEQGTSGAKTNLLNTRSDQSKRGAEIAGDTADKVAANNAKTDAQTQKDKEKNHEDYRKQPVAPAGTCVDRALPGGVQNRIDAAVERARN